jgi:CheY-like chemotaxis protein
MSRILVVDDEAIITMQLEERLQALGYDVVGTAASGEEAIEKARTLEPDLVLMDIVMPGKFDGIEAARTIIGNQDIPVVFVTSYADDAIIQKAKQVKPYGYIVKPFNELEIKAAIEVALFRREADRAVPSAQAPALDRIPAGETAAEGEEEGYRSLPEMKTLLLRDIFTDLILFLYTDQTVKDPIFKWALEEGLTKGGRTLFAYYQSILPKYFPKEIQHERLFTLRIRKNEARSLLQRLELCCDRIQGERKPVTLQVLLDFSETEDFDDIVAIKQALLARKEKGFPVSGILALNIGRIDHHRLQVFSGGIPRVIVSTGPETTLSFSHHTLPPGSVSVVPQETMDMVVKKSLEPVVLSLLDKPISGYDIVREIYNRYHVLIPQARIYAILYSLEEQGYLEMRASGKSKLYVPTETGKKYIGQRMNEFKATYQHILAAGPPAGSGSPPASGNG